MSSSDVVADSIFSMKRWSNVSVDFDGWLDNVVTPSVFRFLESAEILFVKNNPREHSNEITAWIDGGNIYGSSQETENKLRSKRRG